MKLKATLFFFLVFSVLSNEISAQIPDRFEFNDTVVYVGQRKLVKVDLAFCSSPCWVEKKYYYPEVLLDSIGDFLKNNPKIQIKIECHTDQRGSEKPNLILSQKRADNFKEEICGKGNIRANRVMAKGYGETQPIIELDSISKVSREEKDKLYQQNRRTIITIVNDGLAPLDLNSNSVVVGQTLVVNNLNTEFRGTITHHSKPFMDSLIRFLNRNDDVIIEVANHTDNRGASEANIKLSERRAEAFKHYLVNTGLINEDRIITKGYGEERPIICLDSISKVGEEDTEKLYRINRRYEVRVVKRENTILELNYEFNKPIKINDQFQFSDTNIEIGQRIMLNGVITSIDGKIVKDSLGYIDSLITFLVKNKGFKVQILDMSILNEGDDMDYLLYQQRDIYLADYILQNSEVKKRQIKLDKFNNRKSFLSIQDIKEYCIRYDEYINSIETNRSYIVNIIKSPYSALKEKEFREKSKVKLLRKTSGCLTKENWKQKLEFNYINIESLKIRTFNLTLNNSNFLNKKDDHEIAINLYELKNKDLIQFDKKKYESGESELIYTKSYVIHIVYLKGWKSEENKLEFEIISELKQFFKENYNNL